MTEKTHDNDLTGPVPGNAGVEANIENMEAMGFDPENLDMILNGTVEGLMSDYPALRNDDTADMMISKARSLIGTVVEYEELRMMYACALKEIKAKFDVLNTEFKVRYSRNPISFINTRLKKTVSISEKLGRKNLAFSVENIEKHINDVAGIRVICSYVDDIYAIEEALLKQSDVVLVCRKDYISASKPNGYRSLHLIVKIPVHFAEHKREMKVEVHRQVNSTLPTREAKQGCAAKGFIAGIVCSAAVAAALWWWQVYPMQQQLTQVSDTAQGAATVWMASPELKNYEHRLRQLLDASPVQPLETGMQMMRVADSRWPESLQQQQASTQWNEALKTRAQSSPQLRGWLQTRQDLHAFADLVMQREKEGLTLSYIKNVIWQAERGLGQETPVESLLTQYHDARAQKQNTDALEKQINERLEGVLSRWLLLKNNVMPEAATGTTAEK